MFHKFLEWIKRILNRLPAEENPKAAEINLQPVVSETMENEITLYGKMYSNNAPWIDKTTQSLNLPAAIASEFARLVTIEFKSEITGSPRADYLNNQYQRFLQNIRKYCEFGCAFGGFVAKPYIDNKKISIDVITAERFVPVAFDSDGNMTGAIFLDQITKGKVIYTRYELHAIIDSGYYIKNVAYASKSKDMQGSEIGLDDVDEWKDIRPETTFPDIDRPLFGYFRVPQANNIDPTSPLGTSVYSRAVDLIKQADLQYSRMLWEFEGGELAIDADETVFRPNELTGEKQIPKGKERLFRLLFMDSQPGNSKSLVPFAPQLRDQSFINGLNKLLQRIEFNCGLAYGTLSDPSNVDKTATEIKISRQRSYATVADIQKALQAAIEELIYAMDMWATIGKLAPTGKYESSFDWDDSIIVDNENEQQIRMQEVGAGILRIEDYLMWRYGVTEDQARKMMPGMEQLTDNTPNDEAAKSAAVSKAEDVAGKTLNGAQTQSLISVIAQYQADQLTIGQAINIIAVAIGVTKDEAKKILEGAE